MNRISGDELFHLFILNKVEGLGPGKLFQLLSKFGSFEEIVNAGRNRLMQTETINEVISGRIKEASSKKDQYSAAFQRLNETLSKNNARIITYWDDEYPELLKRIYLPPVVLYVKGAITDTDSNAVAIVGTRLPSAYGRMQATRFASELAAAGVTIVSGLARGIDSESHRAALKSGGRTIAVTGSGIDVIYPPENKKIYNQIADNGAIITEYPPGTFPDAQNFPRRNRIISGLALGTLVVETKKNGGAMQTASYSLDQNREVFAVPGNITSPQSDGTNKLIRKGEAELVTRPDDILTTLRLDPGQTKKADRKMIEELNLFEQKIFESLSAESKHIDVIASDTGITVADCLVYLLTLEFKGLARQLPGKMFSAMM